MIDQFFYKIGLTFSITSRSKNGCSDLNCYKQFMKNLPRATEPRKLILTCFPFNSTIYTSNYPTLFEATILRIFIQKFKPTPS